MATGDYIVNMGHLIPLGQSDIHGDDLVPQHTPGSMTIVKDPWGPKFLMYVKTLTTIAAGGLMKREANVSGGTITAGTTTSFTTSSLTAGKENGKIAYVTDNADVAGGAPEGEAAQITSNTATRVGLDADNPLTVALANADTVTMISTYHGDTASAVLAVDILGVNIGRNGITANQYGWVVRQGRTIARSAASTQQISKGVIAGTGVIALSSTSAAQLLIGTALSAMTSDCASTKFPVEIQLLTCSAGVTI